MLALAAGAAVPQSGRLSIDGRVMRQAEGAQVPLLRQWVILHTITAQGGNPSDSVRADANGGFRFTVAADSSAVYLVSTSYGGIAYFSQPVHGFGDAENDLPPLVVYDTTSGGPPIAVGQRHVVVGSVQDDGSHDIIDILDLVNDGRTTRVSASDDDPTWVGTLPNAVAQFSVRDGDVGPDAVQQRGDSVFVYAPLPPGSKQLTLSYRLSGDTRNLEYTVDQPVRRFNVLSEDPSTELIAGPLLKRDARIAEGRAFQFFVADTVPAGTELALRLGTVVNTSRSPVLLVVLGTAAALIVGVVLATRKAPKPVSAQAPVGADVAARIAVLDRQYAGGEGSVSAEEWVRYQQQRAELKEELKVALAQQTGRS